MSAEFAHLHVASGFSMRYGTATPQALVERAAQHRQPILALTDRDGLYGAVRFVQAATAAGIAPVLGVDLAVGLDAVGLDGVGLDAVGLDAVGLDAVGALPPPTTRPAPSSARSAPVRAPARGGADRDARHPRVTVLARGRAAGLPAGVGWAALCRLVTQTHLRGERGAPVSSAAVLAAACGPDGGVGQGARDRGAEGGEPSPLVVLLGPDSDVGRALLAKRTDRARELLTAWRRRLPPDAVVIEVVCASRRPGGVGGRRRAGRRAAAGRPRHQAPRQGHRRRPPRDDRHDARHRP